MNDSEESKTEGTYLGTRSLKLNSMKKYEILIVQAKILARRGGAGHQVSPLTEELLEIVSFCYSKGQFSKKCSPPKVNNNLV